MRNGVLIPRPWLIYSKTVDAVYCFCCRIFAQDRIYLTTGFFDWNHATRHLKEHERSVVHMACFKDLKIIEKQLVANCQPEAHFENQRDADAEHWH